MSQFQSYFIISIYLTSSYLSKSKGQKSKEKDQRTKIKRENIFLTIFLNYTQCEYRSRKFIRDGAHIFTASTQFISEKEATTNSIYPPIVTHAQPQTHTHIGSHTSSQFEDAPIISPQKLESYPWRISIAHSP